jgi:hypothetical protein
MTPEQQHTLRDYCKPWDQGGNGGSLLAENITAALDALDKAEAENARLRAVLARLSAGKLPEPSCYWDDDGGAIGTPADVRHWHESGAIVMLRPVHELPAVWALVEEHGVRVFDTRGAAEAAALEGNP